MSSFSVKTGGNKPENFTTQFRQPIFLDPNSQYVVGLNRIINMSFTWHNINAALKNQLIRVSSDGGKTFSDITFPAGVWDYSSLNEAIRNATGPLAGSTPGKNEKFPINLGFSLTTFRVTITLEENWQLDLTPSNFGNLIGFDKKILKDKLNIGKKAAEKSGDLIMKKLGNMGKPKAPANKVSAPRSGPEGSRAQGESSAEILNRLISGQGAKRAGQGVKRNKRI